MSIYVVVVDTGGQVIGTSLRTELTLLESLTAIFHASRSVTKGLGPIVESGNLNAAKLVVLSAIDESKVLTQAQKDQAHQDVSNLHVGDSFLVEVGALPVEIVIDAGGTPAKAVIVRIVDP